MVLVALILSYLLGSLPAGAWVARMRGVDIRAVGSGNTGATNVLRSLGWGPGLLVALFDALKGALAILLARAVLHDPPIEALCGALAVLGHNFSVFLRFHGGKGVATSLGTMLVIDPLVGLAGVLIGGFCIGITRFVSAGSMVGAVAAVVVAVALRQPWWDTGVVAFLAALLIWQHRGNLRRLHSGNENRFLEKKPDETA